MLDAYRQILCMPGAIAFSSSAFVGRMPISMVTLGIVLLVSTRTGSYATAGGVVAAYVVANAVFGIPKGRITDRLGQTVVLPLGSTVFGVALLMLVWSIETAGPDYFAFVAAIVAGAAVPVVGSAVRARWISLLPDKGLLQTAFAYEAMVDELIFILGPAVVVLLSTTVGPSAGLIAAVVTGTVGTGLLAVQVRTAPAPIRASQGSSGTSMPWASLARLVACSALLGVVFGSVEVAVVAFCDSIEHREFSGWLLAVWASGSLISGFITGALSRTSNPERRLRDGMAALTLSAFPLMVIDSAALMGVVLFVGGLAISPTLIALMTLTERAVPPGRITEGLSAIQTGTIAGLGGGAVATGQFADRFGASASFQVCVIAGMVGLAIASMRVWGQRWEGSGATS